MTGRRGERKWRIMPVDENTHAAVEPETARKKQFNTTVESRGTTADHNVWR
jgi:hypothetical protein